jgi:hypothetical protein
MTTATGAVAGSIVVVPTMLPNAKASATNASQAAVAVFRARRSSRRSVRPR